MEQRKMYYQTEPLPIPDDFDAVDWEEDEDFPRISNVVSACECTGMMPRPPVDEEEDAAYRSLFSNELPKKQV